MKGLLTRLQAGEVLLADGAMGTLLMDRGLEAGACPETVNLEHPEWLEEVARLYREAGADILHTNTFGGSPLKLAYYSLDHRTEEIMETGVRAARAGADGRACVAVSCGPCGRLLRPYGDTEPEEVLDGFRRQLAAAAAAGVDLITVETMTDLAEATLAIRAAREVAPDVPVAATMTFDDTPRGFFTIMGVSVAQAAAGLAEAGADIVGSNCGTGIETMIRVAAEYRRHTPRSLLVQANAGLPETVEGRPVFPDTPEFMAGHARELLASGVGILGGCCGTTPAHIAAFRRIIAARHRE